VSFGGEALKLFVGAVKLFGGVVEFFLWANGKLFQPQT
jgi:hypothetical protein